MSTLPVKLGSASQPRLIFQEGSTITISDSGIQECSIKALCPDGQNVFNYIPPAGATYDSVFGNDYLPADFKVDRSSNSSVQITYEKGQTASITLSFKRPDPEKTGAESRKVSFDTAYRFCSQDFQTFLQEAAEIPGLDISAASFGIPEPVVTVRYNAPALPSIGGSVTVLPGASVPSPVHGGWVGGSTTSPTSGFPTCESFTVETTHGVFTAQQQPAQVLITTYLIRTTFGPSPAGWQLTGLKADPVADKSFFDVTETWRRAYVVTSLEQTTVSTVPYTGP